MKHTGTIFAIVAIVVFLGGGAVFAGLAGWKPLGLRFEDDAAERVAITEIRVEGGSGSVEVRPGSASQVDIHRKVTYLRALQDRPGATHRVEGSVLHLATNWGNFPEAMINYVVTAPPGVRVSGRLGSGSLRLSGVSDVDVETSSGGITLTGVTGDVTAKSSSGSITGRDMRSGPVKTTTSSGRISLDLSVPCDVRARTSSGRVRLAVSDGPYRIDAGAKSGRVDVDLPSDPTASHLLELRSSSGRITVTRH